MTKLKASIDTNIIGHLYRSETVFLIDTLFEKIYVDEYILVELRRRCNDIYDDFLKDLEQNSIFEKIERKDLIEDKLSAIYDLQLDGMRNLFFPQDEGEKKAIALAQSKGAPILLTDDEKNRDGPYHIVNDGLISVDMGALSFWDLIFLNIINGSLTSVEGSQIFQKIKNQGYDPPYRGTFRSKIEQSVRIHTATKHTSVKEWYKEWNEANSIPSGSVRRLLQTIKHENL